MTLIQVGRRRCDARCYNAKRAKCHCVCDGRNHQAGEKQAAKNTLDHAQAYVRAFPDRNVQIRAQLQMAMFPAVLL